MEIVYQLLGRLLLLLVKCYQLLWWLHQRLHAIACGSYDYWRHKVARECERVVLEQCKAELTKRPRHLVLVVSPDDRYVNAGLLKRIFNYASIIGIEHVSVYDTRDKNKGYVDLAQLCKSKEDDRLVWSPSQVGHRSRPLNGVTKPKTNGHKNGVHSQELQLYQISAADGHALIADVCRELYENRSTALVQSLLLKRETLTEQINSMLNKRLCFTVPEPELGIIFAYTTCTYGLLPWHVRFTEFHTHPSCSYFNAKTFVNVLYKYSRCEQRWGK